MKRFALFLLCTALLGTLAGCRRNVPQETDGSIVPSTQQNTPSTQQTQQTQPSESTAPSMPAGTSNTDSAKILQKIWDSYGDDQKFAAYGGAVEQSVADAPGDLDITVTEELTSRYLLPQEQLSAVDEGASLVHLMNNNIFTAVVFRLSGQTDAKAFADSWRSSLRSTQWICGQPDRMLLAQVENNHVLLAFGSQDAMTVFQQKLTEAYPDSKTFYQEAVGA